MKRGFAAVAMTAALTATGLMATACGETAEPEGAAAAEEAAADAVAVGDPLPPAPTPASTTGGAAIPAAEGAPAFAVIYPGGVAEGPAVMAQGPTGPGGILTYTTEATPEAVVAFYKDRAEAAGLKSINAMSQGDARGYAAGDGADGRGQLLSVVATPVEGGPTSVQLDWTAGR